MELSYDPVILLLGMYLKKPKTLIQKNICIPVFIAVLLTIAMLWKQPRCPSVHDWIIKTCGTFTQWDTARPLKKNEILSFQTVWMDLQGITLGEISQRRTNTMWSHLKVKLLNKIETDLEKRLQDARREVLWGWVNNVKGLEVLIGDYIVVGMWSAAQGMWSAIL